MKVALIWLFAGGVLLFGGCKKYSDAKGAYRASSDGTMQIYYLEPRIAFVYYQGINSGRIESAYAVGDPDYKAQTGDQIVNTLVDHIKSLNREPDSGAVYGELYEAGGKDLFFIFQGKTVTYFPSEAALKERLPEASRAGSLTLYSAKDFMDKFKEGSR